MDGSKNNYDLFAYYYNKIWTVNTPYLMDDALSVLAFDKIKKGARILDLCCGTGHVDAILNSRGYNVTGVDDSGAMLAYARYNAPESTYIKADARYFDLKQKFDAIICIFDSINHFTERSDVAKIFANVHEHLTAGGVFVFDVNALPAFQDSSEMDFSEIDDTSAVITKATFNKKTNISTFTISMFKKINESSWAREDAKVYEKFYETKDLMEMLGQAGFHTISIADGDEDLGIESFKDRLFFTAVKDGAYEEIGDEDTDSDGDLR